MQYGRGAPYDTANKHNSLTVPCPLALEQRLSGIHTDKSPDPSSRHSSCSNAWKDMHRHTFGRASNAVLLSNQLPASHRVSTLQ